MFEIFDTIIEKFLNAPAEVLYLFLFISAVVENLFPPIPGDTITALGAFLVGQGKLDFTIVFALTTLGSTAGFFILYGFGWFLGKEFFIQKDYRFFPAKSISHGEHWFSRYGYFVVLANRFLPGIRSVISLVAGASMLRPLRVFFFALISAAVWNFIWIQAGYSLGNNWGDVRNKVEELLEKYNTAAAVVLVIITICWISYTFYKKYVTDKKSTPSS